MKLWLFLSSSIMLHWPGSAASRITDVWNSALHYVAQAIHVDGKCSVAKKYSVQGCRSWVLCAVASSGQPQSRRRPPP